jgi:hypothetical protein
LRFGDRMSVDEEAVAVDVRASSQADPIPGGAFSYYGAGFNDAENFHSLRIGAQVRF